MNRKLPHFGITFLHCRTRRRKIKPSWIWKHLIRDADRGMNQKILPPVSLGLKWSWSSSWGAQRWQQQWCWIRLWSPSSPWVGNIKVLPSNIIPTFPTELTVNDLIFHFLFFSCTREDKTSLFRCLQEVDTAREWKCLLNALAGWIPAPYLRQAPQFPGQSRWHN